MASGGDVATKKVENKIGVDSTVASVSGRNFENLQITSTNLRDQGIHKGGKTISVISNVKTDSKKARVVRRRTVEYPEHCTTSRK